MKTQNVKRFNMRTRNSNQFEYDGHLIKFIPIKFLDFQESGYFKYDFKRLINDCVQAIEIDPEDYDAWSGLGIGYTLYRDKENRSNAIKCFKRAYKINPDNPRALSLYLYAKHIKDFKHKLVFLNKLKKKNPDFEEGINKLKQELMAAQSESMKDFTKWCSKNNPYHELIKNGDKIRAILDLVPRRVCNVYRVIKETLIFIILIKETILSYFPH